MGLYTHGRWIWREIPPWVLFVLIIQNDHLFLIASKTTPGFESRTPFRVPVFFFAKQSRGNPLFFFVLGQNQLLKRSQRLRDENGWKINLGMLTYTPPQKKMKEFRYQKKMIRWKEWTCGSAASSKWMIVVGVSILLNFRVVNSVGSWALWNDLLPNKQGKNETYGLGFFWHIEQHLFFERNVVKRGERFMKCLV